MTKNRDYEWIRSPGVGGKPGTDRLLMAFGRHVCTVHMWTVTDWWWETYDGKNTQVAGEPFVTLQEAKSAALAWAKERARQEQWTYTAPTRGRRGRA